MEQTTSNGQLEKLKENIDAVSQKSKETIRYIINSSSRQFETALEANKEFIESIETKSLTNDLADTAIVSDIKKTFSNSVELSEEAIDTIIDIQSSQLRTAIDFNLKLAETIRNLDLTDNEYRKKLFEVIDKNFEESSSQLIENTKKMTEIYNKHINLAVNFNEQFAKNINDQLQMLNRFQNKNMDMFNDWATHWWKAASKEEAAV